MSNKNDYLNGNAIVCHSNLSSQNNNFTLNVTNIEKNINQELSSAVIQYFNTFKNLPLIGQGFNILDRNDSFVLIDSTYDHKYHIIYFYFKSVKQRKVS